MISQIKTHPVLLAVVRDKTTGELDKRQIPFFKNDFEEFFERYPDLRNVRKPNGESAKPFSIHYFPHLTLEMCQELRSYVETNRDRILRTKQGLLSQLSQTHTILTPDLLSTESMDTSIIPQLDIDHPSVLEHPFIQSLMAKNPPYWKSCRKQLPKIPLRVKNMPPNHSNRLTHKNENGDVVLELLCGQNSYRDTSASVENIANEIPEIDYYDLINTFPDMHAVVAPTKDVVCRNLPDVGATGGCSPRLVEYVLRHLDVGRANDYNKWFAVLCAIYNCYEDKEEACRVAQEWSKNSSKYDESKWCEGGKDREMFMRLHNCRNGFHTLRFYLKQDDLETYKCIFPATVVGIESSTYVPQVEKNLIFKFSERTVAELFKSLPISKNYVFCDEFYEFDGVLYRMETSLAHCIYNSVEPILSNYLFDLEKQEKEEKKIYKDIQKYVKDIGKTSFLNGVKRQLQHYLQNRNFKDLLDTNLTILAFDDCVFDLNLKRFRPSTPEDYCFRSVGYNRPTSNPVIRKELQDCFRSMFEEEDVYNYMRALNASCLFRGNVNHLFPIWTGRGSNGKSSFMNLKQKALGRYSINLPVSVLTSEVKGHATSDLPMTRGCRHIRCDEPKATTRIQSNTVKIMTGGDPITCRGLYKESITFTITGIMELLSNAMPLMDSYDYAVGRRLSPIPYTKQFLNENTKEVFDPNNKNHRYRDERLKEKLETPAYYQEYLLMMLDDYLEFFPENEMLPPVPQTISNTAMQYEEDNTDSQDISGWFDSAYEFISHEEYMKDVKVARKRYGRSMRQMLIEYRRDTKDTTMDERKFQLAFRELEGYNDAIKYKNNVIFYLIKSKLFEEDTYPTSSALPL